MRKTTKPRIKKVKGAWRVYSFDGLPKTRELHHKALLFCMNLNYGLKVSSALDSSKNLPIG